MLKSEKPVVKNISARKLIGKKLKMTLAADRTFELWSGFMPRRKEIIHKVNSNLWCLQVYDKIPHSLLVETEFEKWAAVEVTVNDKVPGGMESIELSGGLYAVFIHIGPASGGPESFKYIFETWLPNSEYTLDHRIHFQIMGPLYKNDDPNAEEELWVPIKGRGQ